MKFVLCDKMKALQKYSKKIKYCGKMTEWSNVVAWKAAVVKATVGSSYSFRHTPFGVFLFDKTI